MENTQNQSQEPNNVIQASLVAGNWEGKVPKESLELLKGRLSKITDEQRIASFNMLQLKSPIIGLILGLMFGWIGVDRYYKGDIGLGIIKFLTCFIAIGFIWAIVDLFLVWKGIKSDNFNKINNQLLICGA